MSRRFSKCLLQFCTIFITISGRTICSAAPPTDGDISKTEPALLVVSYDAFRPEYFRRGVTPYMNKFRKEGTSAEFVFNVFPTKTFPNHHSIATGFYPKTHGILANSLYDAKLGKLDYSYDLFHYNESIWPIWTANEKAGKHSGCMMWPGSNYKYDGTACTFGQAFDPNMTWTDRVDTAVPWFTDKNTPANLVMLYIEEPDVHAHVYSPDSNVTTKLVSKLDDLTQYIQQKLIDNGLERRVNVIHLSDHGMSSVTPPYFINLTDFVRNETVTFYGSSPVLQIVPTDNNLLDEIHANLTKGARQNGHFKVYTPDNLPLRWRASLAQRMGPLLAVADMKYAFQDMYTAAQYYQKLYNVPITPTTQYGVHGYDNAEELMHAIFMAKGPLFASGQQLEPFDTVDLYNLFCRILKIECKQNEGTDRTSTWDLLLRTSATKPVHSGGSGAGDGGRKPGKLQQLAALIYDRIRSFVVTPMWLVAAFGAFIVIVSAVVAVIFRRRIRAANATNNPVRLHVSDELEDFGEKLDESCRM